MRFEKVSFEQYCRDCGYGLDLIEGLEQEYSDIKLPKRATKGSAGYDFFLPFSVDLEPNETIKIPTGIRWCVDCSNLVLKIYPRSGLGFKYQLGLANTVGIVDMDYYEAENEGHIQIKLANHGDKTLRLNKGDAFAQGIVTVYITTEDDKAEDNRVGGFGSTNK